MAAQKKDAIALRGRRDVAFRARQDDEQFLIAAAQNDPGCFGELYERNFERVYAFVVRRVSGREEAQDVTAEVFHQALANIGRFEWRGVPFAAWLYRIAANAIADRWQRAAREPGNPDVTGDPADPAGASCYASLQEIEQKAMLFRLVETLPANQRRVVRERFVEQKSIREIAKGLRKTEGAVKQLQFRALQNLRARVGVTHG